MHRRVIVISLLCACQADDKPDPVPPAGTGNVITVSGGGGSGDTSSSSGDSSSTGEPTCTEAGETCSDGRTCVATNSDFVCSDALPGSPCSMFGDCGVGECFLQPSDSDFIGICTGAICEPGETTCETVGRCVTASDGNLLCSHGEIGEPCLVADDCHGGLLCFQRLGADADVWICDEG